MRIGWIGFHREGVAALRALLEQGVRVEGVLTLRSDLARKKSGAADYSALCREFGIPIYEIANINDEHSVALLAELTLDIAFVIGWTQIVRRPALERVTIGMIGAHASLLPRHRGRAPINWALIKGAQHTGNTLIWLAEEVDAGAIIDQAEIAISPYDDCASLYDRVAQTNRDMILALVPRLLSGERPGRPQPRIDEPNLPTRRPEDGLIDWSWEDRDVYNFVRALARPYPGAFSWLDGVRWTIWACALLPRYASTVAAPPGQILGPVYSPQTNACGQLIACGKGAIIALDVEDATGEVVRGQALSDKDWTGRIWRNA